MENVIAGAAFITIQAGAVLVMAALGELVGELSGVLNLGVEGTMAMGAVVAFITASRGSTPFLALTAALAVGAVLGLIMATVVVSLKANQLVVGLALGFMWTGVADQLGVPFAGRLIMNRFPPVNIPLLSGLPVVGHALFSQDVPVYITYVALPILVSFLVFRTRLGISIRASGENPAAADSAGIPVTRIRYLCCCIAGALVAVAGGYLMMAFAPTWQEGSTAGKGWIAIALVIFSGWRPRYIVLGALLFGITTSLGFVAQVQGLGTYSTLLSMTPYLSTLALMAAPSVFAKRGIRLRARSPAALATPYHREEA